MESSGSDRGGLVSAGGVLSIVAGISQIISGVSVAIHLLVPSWPSYGLAKLLLLPFLPEAWLGLFFVPYGPDSLPYGIPIEWVIVGGCVGVLGILAVVGGISAIRRKRFGLSLVGAICALPSYILGIPAVIFVALGKREFGAERKENGI